MIESVNNAKVKEWTKLQEKKYRDNSNTFLVEGVHLVDEAIKKNLVKELIILEGTPSNYDISYSIVNEKVMKKICNQITAVVNKLKEQEICGDVLILDNLADPGNLGTIIRSAVAFNIPNLVLSLDTVDLYNPKVIRSSEGMIFHINIVRKDIEKYLNTIKDTYQIIGTNVVNGEFIENIIDNRPVALIIGNEGKGMNEKYNSLCDKFAYIPMNNHCESLNAGVSASILMYEIAKKRGYHDKI